MVEVLIEMCGINSKYIKPQFKKEYNECEKEIEIYKKGSGFYGDTGEFDFSAKNVKELKKILKDIGANPDRPSFGELPKK